MPELTLDERTDLATRIVDLERSVADEVTDEFYRRHPDWLELYGERGRQLAHEDAGFHVRFLAGSVESGDPEAFADYVRWAARMLASRGLHPRFLDEHLEQIGDALRAGLPEADRDTVLRHLRAGRSVCAVPPAPSAEFEESLASEESRVFLQAILAGNRAAAATVALESLRRGSSLADVYSRVLQPALVEVGRRWESNEITVAQEHMATAVAQSTMARLYAEAEPPTPDRGRCVITGVQGELHQVGAHMVADVLDFSGWNVRFLGTDLPHSGILQEIRDHRPRLVGISATVLSNLGSVQRLVREIREATRDDPPRIILGGALFRSRPELTSELGADGSAGDAESALELVDRLFAT